MAVNMSSQGIFDTTQWARSTLVRPEELNKIILLLLTYGGDDGLPMESLISILRNHNFGGQTATATQTVKLARELRLVESTSDHVVATTAGRRFRALNLSSTYELAPGQAEFIFDSFIESHSTRDLMRVVLKEFRRDSSRGTFVGQLPLRGGRVAAEVATFLRQLEVLDIKGSVVLVRPEFASRISRLLHPRTVSAEELELRLALRKAQGDKAEQWVVACEQKRLRNAGHIVEADIVEHVSIVDVCAGYDIMSFDGHSSWLSHDRFIEVKSTSGITPRFIWTDNERTTAAELGTKYWIYLLAGFDRFGSVEDLIIIRNPVSELEEGGRLQAEPISYAVTVMS
jgi:hypothetical protein